MAGINGKVGEKEVQKWSISLWTKGGIGKSQNLPKSLWVLRGLFAKTSGKLWKKDPPKPGFGTFWFK